MRTNINPTVHIAKVLLIAGRGSKVVGYRDYKGRESAVLKSDSENLIARCRILAIKEIKSGRWDNLISILKKEKVA